jgi:dihydroorotase
MSEHPNIRSAEACFKSSSLAVRLAKDHDARLHVLHLTTARELSLFESGPIDAKRITAEVCAHHLWFDDGDYARMGTRIKCNPAIKSEADRRGLIAAVNEGRIDIIATDHAPHKIEEKERGYFEAPSGLPLVQHVLNMLIDQYRQGLFSLETIVRKTAHNPAILFGIENRGFVREGYFADLAIVDLEARTFVDKEHIRYKCGWSPFEGYEFGSRVAMTILGGQVVFDRGVVHGAASGAELVFVAV